jgi:hypothetical protein
MSSSKGIYLSLMDASQFLSVYPNPKYLAF